MGFKEIEPIKTEKLNFIGNAIDFKDGFHGWGKQGPKSVAYEDLCFQAIADKLKPNNFAIGPHIIDDMLGISSVVTTGVARPDAIIFEIDGLDRWKIKRLCEFKSGKGNGIANKLDGFSKLLSNLREHKYFLPTLLVEYLGENICAPSDIIVPPDNKIEVMILKPKIREADVICSNVGFSVVQRKMAFSSLKSR